MEQACKLKCIVTGVRLPVGSQVVQPVTSCCQHFKIIIIKPQLLASEPARGCREAALSETWASVTRSLPETRYSWEALEDRCTLSSYLLPLIPLVSLSSRVQMSTVLSFRHLSIWLVLFCGQTRNKNVYLKGPGCRETSTVFSDFIWGETKFYCCWKLYCYFCFFLENIDKDPILLPN